MIRRALIVGSLVFLAACGGAIGVGDQDGGAGGGTGTAGGTGTGGGSGSGGGAGSGNFAGLSCDVANLLATKCTSCHGSPLTGGASFPLLSRADLITMSPSYSGQTYADRSLVRMQATTAPMPPAPNARATAAEIAALQAWVNAGSIEETCANAPDAGMGNPDAGPAPTVCTSGSKWTFGNAGSSSMNPGQACVACHQTQEPFRAYYFMGTAYPTTHEQTNCNAAPPSGIVVEIIDANGNTALTIPVRSPSGNFYSTSRSAGIALPYRARIKNAQGQSLEMMTPQTSGDCNSCHTEQGANGAAGRIVWPQ